MDDEDLIREQMEETRTALSDKLETLENKVVSTVEGASDNVTETVESVTDKVQETVASVTDTVQETVAAVKEGVREGVNAVQNMLDCKQHFQNHPWMMLGGSIVAGFALAEFLSRGERASPDAARALLPSGRGTGHRSHHGNGHQGSRGGKNGVIAGPAEPSPFQEEWQKLKGLAVGALLGALREVVVKSLPPDLGPQLTQIVDSFTRKMGGEPMPEKAVEEVEQRWQRHAS